MQLVVYNVTEENAAEALRAVAELIDEGYTSGIDPIAWDYQEEEQ